MKQRIRHNETDLVHKQRISLTSELNGGIKELNDEVKKLYENLIRLDARISRKKRDSNNCSVDCAKMNGNFKKILKELSEISETLSSANDRNGTCRCECPSDQLHGSTADVTDLPFELTTFNLNNADEPPRPANEKTKQLKQILVSPYDPKDDAADGDTDKETVDTTANDENEFTAAVSERTATTAETKDDMYPAMSNAVTNYAKNDDQTADPSLRLSHNEIVTVTDDEDSQTTPETPTSSSSVSAITDSHETAGTTEFNYEEISTETEDVMDDQQRIVSGLTTAYENISESISDVPNFDVEYTTDNSSDNVTDKPFKPAAGNVSISESTTETTNGDKKNNDGHVTEGTFETTSGNIFKTTSVLDGNADETKNKGRSSSENRDENGNNKFVGDRSTVGKNNDEIGFTRRDYNKQSTPLPENIRQQQPEQGKWYPVCFTPVLCPPNALNYRQNANENTVQYSAQSLGTYKRKSPVADATVVRTNYPIVTYCPMGAICPMTDVAGQANTLHCMWKFSLPETYAVNNKEDNENVTNEMTKHNYNRTRGPATMAKASNTERENDELLTGTRNEQTKWTLMTFSTFITGKDANEKFLV